MRNAKSLHLYIVFIITISVFGSCTSTRIAKNAELQIKYLDEYVIPDNLSYENTKVGGLSGIDFDGEKYYAVADDPKNPRFYTLNIAIEHKKIDSVYITKVTEIKNDKSPLKEHWLDLESILYHPTSKSFTLSSEGSINREKDPSIFNLNEEGDLNYFYNLPEYFLATSENHPRNNGVFESLSHGINPNIIWTATELPLILDGPAPKLYKTKSPVRFTAFDRNTKKAIAQYTYPLLQIKKIPFLPFAVSGITDILMYDENSFFVLERAYSAGHKNHGNNVYLFLANKQKASNTLEEVTLKGKLNKKVIPMEKQLLFNFKHIKKQLTNKQIDNIEGICYGPTLPNGNKTLLVIADDNFNAYSKQLNQIILLELVSK